MINKINRLKGDIKKSQDHVTGLQQALNAKKVVDRMKKVSMIADGVARGELKKSFFG